MFRYVAKQVSLPNSLSNNRSFNARCHSGNTHTTDSWTDIAKRSQNIKETKLIYTFEVLQIECNYSISPTCGGGYTNTLFLFERKNSLFEICLWTYILFVFKYIILWSYSKFLFAEKQTKWINLSISLIKINSYIKFMHIDLKFN